MTFFFVNFQRRLRGPELRIQFQKTFSDFFKIPMGIADWRHVSIAYIDRHCQEISGKSYADLQAAHSEAVAQRYARSNEEVYGVSRRDFRKYKTASESWHALLGLSDKIHPVMANTGTDEMTSIEERSNQTIRNVSNVSNVSEIKDLIKSTIEGAMTSQIQEDEGQKYAVTIPSRYVKALESLFGPGARFRNTKQAEAVHSIMMRKVNVLAVFPTGLGKTLLYMLPSVLEANCFALVITPLVALRQDLIRRCTETHIPTTDWTKLQARSDRRNVTGLVFASVEHVGSANLLNFCRDMSSLGRLSRIVLEEAHLMITESEYRLLFHQMANYSQVPVPFLLLSATVPRYMEGELSNALNLRRIKVFRTSTVRHNIEYRVEDCIDAEQSAIRYMESNPMREDNCRGIVFVRTVAMAEEIAERTETRAYTGRLNAKDRADVIKEWVSGEKKWVIATKALGVGVDIPNVTRIIHVNPSSGLMDYAQESGRAGRNGSDSASIIYRSKGFKVFGFSPDSEALRTYLGSGCRRKSMGVFLDAIAYNCNALGDAILCDNCAREGFAEEAAAIALPLKVATLHAHRSQGAEVWYNANVQTLVGIRAISDKLEGRCPICVCNGRESQHQITRCPNNYGICYECLLPGHYASRCDKKIKKVLNGIHNPCGLPESSHDIMLCPNSFDMHDCKYAHQSKVISVLAYMEKPPGALKIIEDCFGPFESESAYRNFLGTTSILGVQNTARVMHAIGTQLLGLY